MQQNEEGNELGSEIFDPDLGFKPRFVQRDEKFHATMRALHRREEDQISWPIVLGLFLAVWTLHLMSIEAKIDKSNLRHGTAPTSRMPLTA